MSIGLQKFLQNVDAIAAEKPSYQLGRDGSDGKCDCIGLVIGAVRRCGGTWDGIHGSNYAARNEMDYLLPVTDVDNLNVGEVVYKASMPGQTNYNLPSRYNSDPDKNDYYHVGVVRSVNPLRIVHCTTPGIVVDTKLGKWTHRGWLSKVDANGEVQMSEITTAVTAAKSGSTVNFRDKPNGSLVGRVPIGERVIISGEQDGWSRIFYNGKHGWMKNEFLETGHKTEESLETRVEALEKALESMGWNKSDGSFG